jgi:flavin reductase (DIM6/NTAB) family NADH-FMN oxidoreductase RutF
MKPEIHAALLPAAEPQRALRSTLGQFATGVTIVTASDADGAPVGVTINSFNSVSLTPPLILWSLAATASSLPRFRDIPYHAINVLEASQDELGRRFASPGVDRFRGTAYRLGPHDAVLIDGSLAQIVCRTKEAKTIGDHVLFIAEIVHHQAFPGEPLIFHGGQFRR